jgi:hypothetical protein
MEEILKTTLLEYEKSTFLIDLVRHSNGKPYIQILQTIEGEVTHYERAIKINPAILSDIIEALNAYYKVIAVPKQVQNNTTAKSSSKYLTETQKIDIQNRYLKGISIKDLTIQFDCKAILIEQILHNQGIVVIQPPLKRRRYYRR